MGKQTDTIIYSFTGLSSLQIGITGEVIKELIKDQVDLKIVKCDAVIQNCHFNHVHNCLACASCQTRTDFINSQLGIKAEQIIKLKKLDVKLDIPFFSSYKDLLKFEYKGIKIGRGAASSVISHYRDYSINSSNKKEAIEIELRKSALVLENMEEIIKKYSPKNFYIFNGRFAEIYPVLELCKKYKINFKTIESGSKLKYELFENDLPHSIKIRTERMQEIWDMASRDERVAIGAEWFEKKRIGDEKYEKSFKKEHASELLDKVLDSNKENILLLNSSEDELKVIEEWEHDLFDSQNEAIENIVKHFENNPEYNFILRVHPNLGVLDNIQIKEIEQMSFDNLKIIGPNENIDTYQLMDKVDKVVVFGSSTGIEATYWGKPSILLGKSYYTKLDVAYVPENFEELYALIRQGELLPKPKENCYMYGHYFAIYGKELKYFLPNGKSDSIFMGKKIPVYNFNIIKYLIRYTKDIGLWKRTFRIIFQRPMRVTDLKTYKFTRRKQ